MVQAPILIQALCHLTTKSTVRCSVSARWRTKLWLVFLAQNIFVKLIGIETQGHQYYTLIIDYLPFPILEGDQSGHTPHRFKCIWTLGRPEVLQQVNMVVFGITLYCSCAQQGKVIRQSVVLKPAQC